MVGKYIHYGQNKFDYKKLKESKIEMTHSECKPCGLWASPVDAEYGWKEWCEIEEFNLSSLSRSFTFELTKNARILHLHSLEEASQYMVLAEQFRSLKIWKLDSDKIFRHYDGMELHISDDYGQFHDNNIFYLWDVDSICVWNPDVIIPVPKKREKQKKRKSTAA